MLPTINVLIEATTEGFSRGVDEANRRIADLRNRTDRAAQRLNNFGNAAENIGKKMSFLSGGLLIAGGAAAAMVVQTTDAASEIRRFAQISGTTTTEFQRLAAAARTVGIDNEGLAAIFQDVNDRIGDFIATGAGPMADFFENIAPKVGVTAEQFAKLSGPDALQLYVKSLEDAGATQQEMTFYLEALSSNTTRLIPLLADGGAEMRRLGDAASEAGTIMSEETISSAKNLSEEMRELQAGFTSATQKIAAEMIPIFSSFVQLLNERVVPAVQAIADRIAGAIEWFGALPGPVQEAAGVIATALGIGGPAILAIGAFSKALGALLLATGPVGLFIAAAALVGAAWVKWGDDIKKLVSEVSQVFIDRFNEVIAFFQSLPEKFFNFGAAIVQGLLDGINAVWEDLKARILELGDLLPNWLKERLGIASPSKVMHEIGTQIGQGLAFGISDTQGMIAQAIQGATAPIENTAMGAARSVIDAMAQMFEGAKPIAIAQGLINTFQGITEALKLPFPANLGAAAQVAAQGFAAVNAIKSTNVGGGSSGGGRAASSGSASGAGQQPQRVTYINLVGETFNRQSVRGTIETLQEGLDSGSRIIVQ